MVTDLNLKSRTERLLPYMQKDYTSALLVIESYLKTYPMHSRIEEGRVLLGDIQMGRGELNEAHKSLLLSVRKQATCLLTHSFKQVKFCAR